MSVIGAVMMPHPPLIIPAVGRGQEKGIQATTDAMKRAAAFVAGLAAETLVVLSPHATVYADYFHISPGKSARGSFGQFGAHDVSVSAEYDETFADALSELCNARKLAAGTLGEAQPLLDHATLIPLYFIRQETDLPKVVRIGISGLPPEEHYRLGMLIAETAEALGRRVCIVASGDLSHKLKEDGPYGLAPEGKVYDQRIMEVMGHASFGKLFDFKETFCSAAAECGHRSFLIMAGCFDGKAVQAERLSYEGPFGVGYGVCTFRTKEDDATRKFLDQHVEDTRQTTAKKQAAEDPFVALARQAFTAFVERGETMAVPNGLPHELTRRKAGVFVSLHKGGRLRGCIGTIAPTQPNIAEEIIHNAIAACAHDPRFSPVREHELAMLECSVDVLGEAEEIASMDALDPQRYGVIVSRGHRRGLLLPALDGVNTAEEQVAIARRKADIGANEPITLQRFEVIRHH